MFSSNEKVDKAAEQAIQQRTVAKSLLSSNLDLFSHINKFIRQRWFSHWKDQSPLGNKLAQLKNTPTQWDSLNQPTRSHKIIFTRLRVGDRRLIHRLLLTRLHCNNDIPLLVKHLLTCFMSLVSPPNIFTRGKSGILGDLPPP